MDIVMEQVPSQGNGFINHMTNFNDETKSDLLNVAQYSLMILVPIVILNKLMGRFVPDVDENKGSLEISAEVLGQLLVLLFAFYFINRLVTYVKPYSGVGYGELNMITLGFTFVVVVLSFQTQIAEKVEILYGRVVELWSGEPYKQSDENTPEPSVRITQPITQSAPTHQASRADYIGAHNQMVGNNEPSVSMSNIRHESTLISDLPPSQPQYNQSQQSSYSQQPNFDSMYQEPMAANESFGGFASF